jgi:hypothetical protein
MKEGPFNFLTYSQKVDIISQELKRIVNDPVVIARGEELDRILHRLTPTDYLRRFDV